MNQSEIENPYVDQSPNADKLDTLHLGDNRKPVLTLKHLNKLRKMKELRKLEKLQQHDFLQVMYGLPEENQPSPFG